MRTAQEMLDFARVDQGNIIAIYDKAKANVYKLAFDQVEKTLQENEEVKYTFVSSSTTRKNSSLLLYCGVAVTNKRIIIGGQIKGLLKVSYTAQTLTITNVNSINESYSMIGANLVLETLGDDMTFGMASRELAGTIKNKLWDAIELSKQETNISANPIINQISSADELKKFKDLLDSGIITQEEFDAKKKQLLGL